MRKIKKRDKFSTRHRVSVRKWRKKHCKKGKLTYTKKDGKWKWAKPKNNSLRVYCVEKKNTGELRSAA